MIWCLPLLSSLSGCAGTPWGESLSGSFPPPPEQAPPEQGAPQAPKRLEAEPPTGSPSAAPTAKMGGSALAPQRSPSSPAAPAPATKPKEPRAPKTAASQTKPPSVATAPSPYRVTIRLPQADPSAPAEGVTEALRTAGIPFEVETIERVKGASSQPDETLPSGSAPAPSIRPAPPPR